MVLDARHRSELYQRFVPLLGEDNANALMSEFPSYEADELVTRQFLRAELALTTSDLRADIGALETRLTVRLGAAITASTSILLAAFALFT